MDAVGTNRVERDCLLQPETLGVDAETCDVCCPLSPACT